jgi:hypothetical protein
MQAEAEITADTATVMELGLSALRAVRPRGSRVRPGARPKVDNCFPTDTLVDTETGLRAIAQVEPGEQVWAYDFMSGKWRLAQVELRHDSGFRGVLVTIELDSGEVTATAYHPFWVIQGLDLDNRPPVSHLLPTEDRGQSLPGRWVNSHELMERDIVFIRDGGPTSIRRVTHRQVNMSVCNPTIRGLHTFCVGTTQVLVHNESGTVAPINPGGAAPNRYRDKIDELVASSKPSQSGLGNLPTKPTAPTKQISPNQMNKAIQNGQAPKSIERVDIGKIKGEQTHVHLDDGSALNVDGSWKHGGRQLTNAEKDWLRGSGWSNVPE